MEICELKDGDEKAWDEYVLQHPDSTFYHQIGWKNVVEKSYGHKSYYLLAKEDGEIKGVLPLFFMKSMFFGRKFVSIPFAPYGGVIADSSSVEDLLMNCGLKFAEENNANYMELRNNIQKDWDFPINDKYLTMLLKLELDSELVWERFNNKVRNAVRKSVKSGLEISNGGTNDFYKLYSKNLRDLGSPTHSKNFFDQLITEFGNKIEISLVKHKGETIASAILLFFKDTVISGWAASDKKYRGVNPNNILYWNAIKLACENGYCYFDFGRSIEGSGTYRFKKPWGCEQQQLFYSYCLVSSEKNVPNTSTLNTKRLLFSKMYKELPLTLANIIGPVLRRNYP